MLSKGIVISQSDMMDQKHNEFINISLFSPVKIASEGILKALRYASKKYAKGNLIDLGCGKKPYMVVFNKYVNSYFGVDSPHASDFHYRDDTRVDLWADCTNTGLKDGSFDTLLCTQVLEHIPEPGKLLKEANRLLKKKGIAIMTIPFCWQIHAKPNDFYRFTPYGIKYLFEKNGFEILEIKSMEGMYATLHQLDVLHMVNRERKNMISRLWNRYINTYIAIPIKNLKAIMFDQVFYNDKMCLGYLIIAMKE